MRTSASPFLLLSSVVLVFVACSGTSYTTQEDDGSGGSPGVGGEGVGGQGDGGNGSSTGGSASGGDTSSGGFANTGGDDGAGGSGNSGGGGTATGGTVGSGGTGGVPTGGTSASGGATVGGSAGTGGYGTGGFGTGGLGTGGLGTGGLGTGGLGTGGMATGGSVGTGGSGGAIACPEPDLTACPKVTAQAIDPCPGLEAEFQAALKAARACSLDKQCTATNIVYDLCDCPQVVNDAACDLVTEAKLRRHDYFCQCEAPLCIGCFAQPGGPTCDDNSGLCSYGGGAVEAR